jgi:hypothetical protein
MDGEMVAKVDIEVRVRKGYIGFMSLLASLHGVVLRSVEWNDS